MLWLSKKCGEIVGHVPFNLVPVVSAFLKRSSNKALAKVTRNKVTWLAFSPNLSSPRNALMNCEVSGARIIEYKFTPFDEEELLEYLQKLGMADLLGQIDCSVPGVLSKAGLCV